MFLLAFYNLGIPCSRFIKHESQEKDSTLITDMYKVAIKLWILVKKFVRQVRLMQKEMPRGSREVCVDASHSAAA